MRRKAILCLLLAAATLAVYWPVTRYGFTDYDDPDYLLTNLHVQAGLTWPGVAWAFTTSYANNWHPLTWLSHMLDCQLFGMNPGRHHATSVLLHIANTVLLFLVLLRLTKSAATPPLHHSSTPPSTNPSIHESTNPPQAARCFFVAALFALHPLHVESVAWLAERKDVLSTLFFLLTLWAYVRYAEARGGGVLEWWSIGKRKSEIQPSITPKLQSPAAPALQHPSTPALHCAAGARFYALALFFFTLGLMSKPMLVTTPFVLLLLDYWPLRRLEVANSKSEIQRSNTPTLQHSDPPPLHHSITPSLRLLWEKLPFFALSLGSSVVTMFAQRGAGAFMTVAKLPVHQRFENALLAYVVYLKKLFWPADLACFYPYDESIAPAAAIGAALLLAALTLLFLASARRRPYLLVGWLWYLGTLLPVIGLVQVGSQSMADRYTYIPSIGLFILLAWAAAELSRRAYDFLRATFLLLGAVVLLTCFVLAHHQLGYWRDSESLFRHALAVTPDNLTSELNLGTALITHGKLDEAADCFERVLRFQPDFTEAQSNLGYILAAKGQYAEAIEKYRAVLATQPRFAQAHFLLAHALQAQGKLPQAIAECRLTLEINPDHPPVLNDLAWTLATSADAATRNGAEAVRLAERACRLTKYREAQFVGTLAAAYAEAGRFQEAVAAAEKARDLAAHSGQTQIAQRNEELLQLYRAGKPCRE
jgi:tetratricopeptide (TPR) repeat protein